MENDTYYVARCLDGHPDDFRHLVRRYQPVVLAHLAGKLGSRDSAEEAAQETLVRAYFKMSKLKKPESFFAWLLGIADHVAMEQQRKELIRRKRESVAARTDAAIGNASTRHHPCVEKATPVAEEVSLRGLGDWMSLSRGYPSKKNLPGQLRGLAGSVPFSPTTRAGPWGSSTAGKRRQR